MNSIQDKAAAARWRQNMKLTADEHDQVTILTIQGEFTSDQVDRFRREVIEHIGQRTRDFVLDMSQTQFVDSKALETLLWLQDQAAEKLGQVRLAGCPDYLSKVLQMTRLASYFECHDDVESAMQSLR